MILDEGEKGKYTMQEKNYLGVGVQGEEFDR